MNPNGATTEALRKAAAELLTDGKVDVVVAYGASDTAGTTPIFARNAEQAAQLIFNDKCLGNLAVYLPRKEVQAMGKIGLVVKGCDRRAVNVLLREHVIERDNVVLIGVRCASQSDPALPKCGVCDCHEPADCDVVVGGPVEQPEVDASKRYAKADEIDAMSLEDRWSFWQEQLRKCIRCYACRQVCPLCYCKRCIVEKSVPQWIETSAHLRGNLSWNVARAMHLTGRCVGCGASASARWTCPSARSTRKWPNWSRNGTSIARGSRQRIKRR